jgi:hypothetical protein
MMSGQDNVPPQHGLSAADFSRGRLCSARVQQPELTLITAFELLCWVMSDTR